MNEDEFFSDSGLRPVPPDDLSPQVREWFCASRDGDRRHMENCPDCLQDEARITLMDAAPGGRYRTSVHRVGSASVRPTARV